MIFVTTYNSVLYKAYAHQLITSYLETKQTIPMYVFVEDDPINYPQRNNVHYVNLFEVEPDCKAFVERNKHRVPADFFEDAVRFSYKVFAQSAARNYGEKIFYVDSDSKFMKTIPDWWYEQCLPNDTFLTYYDRPGQYTETGFVAFNSKLSISTEFFKEYKDWYVKDRVYLIKRLGKNFWTDCHTLDGTRQSFIKRPDYKEKALGDGKNGHIMARDKFLNPYIDHRKGPRKHKPNSPEWSKHQ